MQSQDTTASEFFFKLAPWIEANLKRIILVASAIIILFFFYSFYAYNQNQNEITAGQSLTKAMVTSGQQPDAYLKIAEEYPTTQAGQRALLEGAAGLFTKGNYPEAQVQFQKFLDTYPDSSFTPQALLGVATSLDAQGKTDLAISAYQKAASQAGNASVVASAKFDSARIYEAQGKLAEAMKLYEDVIRSMPNSSLGNASGLRAMELRMKLPAPAAKPAVPAAAPLNLGK